MALAAPFTRVIIVGCSKSRTTGRYLQCSSSTRMGTRKKTIRRSRLGRVRYDPGGAREAEDDDLEASNRGGAPQKSDRSLGRRNSEVARQRGGSTVGRVRVMLFRAAGRVQGFKGRGACNSPCMDNRISVDHPKWQNQTVLVWAAAGGTLLAFFNLSIGAHVVYLFKLTHQKVRIPIRN